MLTPAPVLLPPLSLADRFWAYAVGAAEEVEDAPEPLRSVMIVRQFLSAIDRLDTTSPRKAAAAMVAMLRQAELDGDLSYASPEQVRGEILDTRSVVFSLGVVLFERLTGRHPFGAENNRPRRIDRIRKGELGSGVNSFPTVAAGLRSVLVRAMSPFPEERWPDLRQMRELLGQFLAQEAPAPKLPGTVEETRVVRMATDFGRELMQVVAKHDRALTVRPADELPARPTTRRLAIPTSGLSSISGGDAGPARRPSQATPRAGVTLRPVEPVSDSVVTRIHVDPTGATMPMKVDEVKVLEARIDARLRDDRRPVLAAVAPVAPPPTPPAAVLAAAPAIARTRAPRPTPPRIVGAPRSAADTRAALAAQLPPLPPLPAPPPSFDLPLPAPPDSYALIAPPSRRGRALVLAGLGAVIGGGLALALFLALGSSSGSSSSAASPADDVPTTPSAPPSLPPAISPTPAAAALTPDPEPAPATPASATSAITLEQQVAAAITACVPTGHHVFGLSLLFRYGVVAKPYYASGDGLTAGQHACISKALKGQSFAGAPKSQVLELKVRAASGSVTVSPWR